MEVSAAHDGLRNASPAPRPPLRESQSKHENLSKRRMLRVSKRYARVALFLSGRPAAELWLLVEKKERGGECVHTAARCVTPGLAAW